MFVKNSLIDAGLEFKPGRVQLCKVHVFTRNLVMFRKCYRVAFKLRAATTAEGKSKEAAA